MAGDLFFWHRERQRACIGSLTIGSLILLKTEYHFISNSLSSDTFDSQWPRSTEVFWSPLMVSTHKGLIYDIAHSSALQATAARDMHGR